MTRRAFLQAGLVLPLTRDSEAATPLSVVLTSGVLGESWQGDPDTASFEVGQVSVTVPSAGIPSVRLREEVGRQGELIWRRR